MLFVFWLLIIEKYIASILFCIFYLILTSYQIEWASRWKRHCAQKIKHIIDLNKRYKQTNKQTKSCSQVKAVSQFYFEYLFK